MAGPGPPALTVRVLGFGTYDTTRHPRVGIVLDGMRAAGDDVGEVNVAIGLSTADRVEMLKRPWLAYRLGWRLLRAWGRLARRARGRGSFDAVIVGYLGHFDVALARILFPRTTIVLDLLIFAADTADDRGVRSRPALALLRTLDSLAARCADVVLVDTAEHVALVAPRQRHKAVVAPVGASASWFASAAAPRDGPLRVIFFGLFTPLQGAVVIGDALGLLAGQDGIQVTMVGSGQDRDAAVARAAGNPNVAWRDWVPADELPALVARHDVCLGIFGTTPKALRVVPNKVYQGAAAGCAIVTSDTVPQRRALGEAARYVRPGDAAELAQALRRLAADPRELRDLRAAAHRRSVESFAAATIVGDLRRRLAER